MENFTTNSAPVNVSEPSTDASEVKVKRPRGFAALSPERRREISSKGGKVAHSLGVAHQFNREEAQAAGRKGGIAPHKTRGRVKPTVNNEG